MFGQMPEEEALAQVVEQEAERSSSLHSAGHLYGDALRVVFSFIQRVGIKKVATWSRIGLQVAEFSVGFLRSVLMGF
jgi:hypothetical protein